MQALRKFMLRVGVQRRKDAISGQVAVYERRPALKDILLAAAFPCEVHRGGLCSAAE
jgi:hypothetical protein